jgi:hypothetical protein
LAAVSPPVDVIQAGKRLTLSQNENDPVSINAYSQA